MKCPACGTDNLANTKFCENCGKPMSGEVPAYLYPEEEDVFAKIKEFARNVEEKINSKNYKEILKDKNDPLTGMLITFIAWVILRLIGILPFIIIVRILAFLMHPVGLIFSLAVTYVYTTHKDEIDEKIGELKKKNYTETIKDIINSYSGMNDREKEEIDEKIIELQARRGVNKETVADIIDSCEKNQANRTVKIEENIEDIREEQK